MNSDSPFGVIGVFLALLGAGVVLDADWNCSGAALMASGAWCLWKEHRQVRPDRDLSS
jgi:hypothetical protein